MLKRLLRGFAYVYLTLAVTFIIACFGMIWYADGFGKVQEILNPFKIINVFLTAIFFAPGLGALAIAEKLDARDVRLRSQSVDPIRSKLRENESLVQSYGAVLGLAFGENSRENPLLIFDVNRLPAPKEEIRKALLAALRLERDPQARESLKVAYLELASFQPDVDASGANSLWVPLQDDAGPEAILAAARAVVSSQGEHDRWEAVMSTEREKLVEDLRREGLWSTSS